MTCLARAGKCGPGTDMALVAWDKGPCKHASAAPPEQVLATSDKLTSGLDIVHRRRSLFVESLVEINNLIAYHRPSRQRGHVEGIVHRRFAHGHK